MSLKILNKDLKTFAVLWVLLAVISWFGPLILVLGIIGKHQDQEAWYLVFMLSIFLLVLGQYVLLRWWFGQTGLGVPPIYLPIKSVVWIGAAYGFELFAFYILDLSLADAMLGFSSTPTTYVMWLPLVALLLFWRPKYDYPPKAWVWGFVLFIFGLFVVGYLDIFVLDDLIVQLLRPLSAPIVWLASFGFLIACIKGFLLLSAFQRWRVYPGVEERYNLPRSRRFMLWLVIGLAALYGLMGFVIQRNYRPRLLGLQPCGWLDIRLGQSHCVQSWYVDWDIDNPALSPDGQWLATYDEALKVVQIRSVESGEVTARLSVELFVDADYANPELIFSPDGSLLLFSERDHGAYLWDLGRDQLTPVAPVVGAEHFGAYKFSSDGRALAFSVDGELVVWNTQNYKTINRIERPEASRFQFLGDEKAVLIRMKEQVLRWDYLSSAGTIFIKQLEQDETELYSRRLYDAEGKVYTVMEIEDQFYLVYDEQFVQLPLAGTDITKLVEPAPEEFREAGVDADFMVRLEMALSPNGEYLALRGNNWLSVHRTTDGAVLFWVNPCGKDESCYFGDLSINDEGFVLISPSNVIQIWSIEG